MKHWLTAALTLAVALAATAPTAADAKRLGAGKPAGMQRNMPARTAPDAPPARPAQAAPQQAAPATPAAAPAAAAVPPKRNWTGPLAGLAAGLGIGALLSHFGMGGMGGAGGGFGGILMTLLLLGGAAFLVMFLLRRFGPGAGNQGRPLLAGMGAGNAGGSPLSWPGAAPQRIEPVEPMARSLPAPEVLATTATASASVATPPADPAITRVFVPATFDAEAFTRTAKMIFIRLQAANDTADLDDLRRFTTPELFASIRLDLQERGDKPQQTDVVKVDAEVLDVANEAERQIVSVRFHGQVIEEKGAAPTAFNEVWHLVKPNDDSQAWHIAGIEPLN